MIISFITLAGIKKVLSAVGVGGGVMGSSNRTLVVGDGREKVSFRFTPALYSTFSSIGIVKPLYFEQTFTSQAFFSV